LLIFFLVRLTISLKPTLKELLEVMNWHYVVAHHPQRLLAAAQNYHQRGQSRRLTRKMVKATEGHNNAIPLDQIATWTFRKWLI
jgi:hypothetical protein